MPLDGRTPRGIVERITAPASAERYAGVLFYAHAERCLTNIIQSGKVLVMKLLAFTVLLTLFIYFLADGPSLIDILNNY